MTGEEHMKFTWSYELVAPGTITVLVKALQKSVKEKDGSLTAPLEELKDTFAKLFGFSKEAASKNFNESVRLLRKSGVIWMEKGTETADVVSARPGSEFRVNKGILSVDTTNDARIFEYVAARAYDFHVPFRLLIDILNSEPNPIHKEVLRERLSRDMLDYAKKNRSQYYQEYYKEKKLEMERRGKSAEKWRYSLPHLTSLLAIAAKANWISQNRNLVQGIRVEKKEPRITYTDFKKALVQEYDKVLSQDTSMLMVSVDRLRDSICRRFRMRAETFDNMVQTLLLRNMGKLTVYTQRAKESERGVRLPDGLIVYAIIMKNSGLV